MANPELIEYAKNQLKAGSSPNYIRTVLMKQGWGERDVDDAMGIAQSEAKPGEKPAPEKTHKESSPSTRNRFLPIAGTITGILFLIMAGAAIYGLITVSGLIATMESAMTAAGVGMSGMLSTYMIAAWAFAALELLAGIFWIIYGIKELL